MKLKNVQTNVTKTAIGIAILICVLTIILAWQFKLDYSQTVATFGLLFAGAAFYGVLYNMNLTTIHLRKVLAKPLIKVAFNENGEQQATLIFKNGRLESGLPIPWIINSGNAVARYFQIDFTIPMSTDFRKHDVNNILYYKNEGRYILWVNRPFQETDLNLSLAFNVKKFVEIFKDSCEIEYKVFGEWAEPQEGKLKIIIEKQEVPHASG